MIQMSNNEMLQKITLGTEATETVKIEVNDITAEFEIRPLTSGELSKLQAMEKQGFQMKVGVNPQGRRQNVQSNMTDVNVNAGEFNEYQTEAMYTAIAWSLSVGKETVKPDMIKELPTGVPEDLFEHIINISKLSDNDLTVIKTFRKDTGGEDNL